MSELHPRDLTAALHVGLLLLGLTVATAAGVHVLAAADARELLGFGFAGVPRRFGPALDIFVNNAQVLGGVLAACLAVQLGQGNVGDGLERSLLNLIRAICDGALIMGCAFHVLLIGAAFGAYGGRTVEATLAHGPFELIAYSLALGLYVSARRERVPRSMLAAVSLAAVLALALAALLEVFA